MSEGIGRIAAGLFRTVAVGLIVLGGITVVAPFAWMVLTALKTSPQAFKIPPQWLPNPVVWDNFPLAWRSANFPRYFLNSVIVTGATTLLSLLLNSMAGFAFAKYDFWGREKLFILLVSTLMIPFQVTMIPVFIILKNLGWLNSFTGLIVPGIATAYGIFLMRQYFQSFPTELLDAARIDGAGEFRIFLSLVLPLSRPALAALAIITFVGSWNNFAFPLIVVQNDSMRTLPLAVAALAGGEYVQNYPLLMAAATFLTVPVIVVFLALQRSFVEGISMTGLKG